MSSTEQPASESSSIHNPAPETPGVRMPGSFPIPKQGAGIAPGVQGVASGAFKATKEYVQGAQTAVQNAGGKVGEYLPTSVSSYLSSEPGTKKTNTLPSQDTSHNYNPSTSRGVGTLSGETGVAVLPAELTGGKSVDQAVRDSTASTSITNTSPILTTTNNNNSIRRHSDPHTGYIPGTLQDDTSLAKLPEERRLEGLPSHDDESGGRLGKSGGVGALPGSAGESSVALLPDERKEVQKEAIGAGASTTLPASSPLGQSHFVPQTTGREHAFSRDEEKVFGANTNKDFDVPDAVDAALKGVGKTTHIADAGQHSDAHAVGAGSGGLAGVGVPSQMESGFPKKSGFIHKVKGEMKVLSGKISHNETKIEEGRKMMGKN